MTLADDLRSKVSQLLPLLEEATTLVDQASDLCRGLDVHALGDLTLALRSLREACDLSKRRCTHALLASDEQFCRRIIAEGDTTWRTTTHTFSAGARSFADMPSQLKHPDDFTAAMLWIEEIKPECLDIDESGLVVVTGLNELCDERLEQGLPIHPNIKHHVVPHVRVRKR